MAIRGNLSYDTILQLRDSEVRKLPLQGRLERYKPAFHSRSRRKSEVDSRAPIMKHNQISLSISGRNTIN